MKRFLPIFAVLIGLISTSCQKPEDASVSGKPLVVVSIPPYISIVQAIAGDTVAVQSAVPPNFDPHTMEVTPSQRELIQKADLFIAIGEIYENKLLAALREDNKAVRVLQLNKQISTLSYSNSTNFVDACKDTHLHLKASQDVHFWLSPKRLPMQVNVIVDSLAQLKPEQGSTYSDNGDAYNEKVKALDKKIAGMLRPYQKRAVLVPHSALGYFCHDYNLVQIAVECEGKSPLPHDITHVLALAKNSNVACAFTFPQFNNKGVELIANKLNIRSVSLDPLAQDVLANLDQIATDIAK